MTDTNVTMKPGPKNVASALALANASAIAVGVMKGIVGKDIADSINGNLLMQDNLTQMTCARITKKLQERVEAAKQLKLSGY